MVCGWDGAQGDHDGGGSCRIASAVELGGKQKVKKLSWL
jgi:hypothetical protein